MAHSSFEISQTSKLPYIFEINFIQLLLVKAWKLYHLTGASILKPKTEEDVEVIQGAQIWRKISR